jgi:hypothetical protein
MQSFRVFSHNYIPKPDCRGYTIQPPVLPQVPEEKSRGNHMKKEGYGGATPDTAMRMFG